MSQPAQSSTARRRLHVTGAVLAAVLAAVQPFRTAEQTNGASLPVQQR